MSDACLSSFFLLFFFFFFFQFEVYSAPVVPGLSPWRLRILIASCGMEQAAQAALHTTKGGEGWVDLGDVTFGQATKDESSSTGGDSREDMT